MKEKTVTLGEIITDEEIQSLKAAVEARSSTTSVHNSIRKWMDLNPIFCKRIVKLGLIKPYCAYLLEYYLKLT